MINIKIPKDELTKLIKNRVSDGITLKNRPIRIPPTKIVPEDATVEKYNRDFQNWDKTNIRLLKSVFVQSENEYLTGYVEATHNGSNLLTTIKETLQLKIKALTDLMDAIPLFQEEKSSKQENSSETNINLDMRKVFIVHGHNEEIKEKVARIIERLGLTPIILHEQVNHGQTIIEKFESNSSEFFLKKYLNFLRLSARVCRTTTAACL
jgi:hypothetical protein